MTVNALSTLDIFEPVILPEPEREIEGVYIGDLLSWVMSKAQSGDAWITIMSNINILAVASLTDVSAIILADDVELDDEVLNTAKEKGINIISSKCSIFDTAVFINEVL